jgi:DNA invertase Pin-like site-specific DNA recombinase
VLNKNRVYKPAEGESLEVQQRQIKGYCDMHGLAIDEIVVEEGVSGSIPVHERPKGGALLAKLKADDTVISPKLDRHGAGSEIGVSHVQQIGLVGYRSWLVGERISGVDAPR